MCLSGVKAAREAVMWPRPGEAMVITMMRMIRVTCGDSENLWYEGDVKQSTWYDDDVGGGGGEEDDNDNDDDDKILRYYHAEKPIAQKKVINISAALINQFFQHFKRQDFKVTLTLNSPLEQNRNKHNTRDWISNTIHILTITQNAKRKMQKQVQLRKPP